MPDYCGVLNFNGMNFFSSEQWKRIRAFASHTMIYFAVKWTFYTQTRAVLMGFWWLLAQELWIFMAFLLCLVNFEANLNKSNFFDVVFRLVCLFWAQVWMILYNFKEMFNFLDDICSFRRAFWRNQWFHDNILVFLGKFLILFRKLMIFWIFFNFLRIFFNFFLDFFSIFCEFFGKYLSSIRGKNESIVNCLEEYPIV